MLSPPDFVMSDIAAFEELKARAHTILEEMHVEMDEQLHEGLVDIDHYGPLINHMSLIEDEIKVGSLFKVEDVECSDEHIRGKLFARREEMASESRKDDEEKGKQMLQKLAVNQRKTRVSITKDTFPDPSSSEGDDSIALPPVDFLAVKEDKKKQKKKKKGTTKPIRLTADAKTASRGRTRTREAIQSESQVETYRERPHANKGGVFGEEAAFLQRQEAEKEMRSHEDTKTAAASTVVLRKESRGTDTNSTQNLQTVSSMENLKLRTADETAPGQTLREPSADDEAKITLPITLGSLSSSHSNTAEQEAILYSAQKKKIEVKLLEKIQARLQDKTAMQKKSVKETSWFACCTGGDRDDSDDD